VPSLPITPLSAIARIRVIIALDHNSANPPVNGISAPPWCLCVRDLRTALMRKFLVSAAIIGLVAALPPASAQDREHHDQGGQRHGEEHGGDQRGGAPHGGPQSQGGAAPAMQAPPGRGERGEMRDRDAGRSNFRAPSTAVQPNQPPPDAPTNTMRGPDRRFGSDNAMRGPEERRDNDRR